VENTGIYHLNYAIRVNITSNKAHPRQVSWHHILKRTQHYFCNSFAHNCIT
jgi:hypothetical protein